MKKKKIMMQDQQDPAILDLYQMMMTLFVGIYLVIYLVELNIELVCPIKEMLLSTFFPQSCYSSLDFMFSSERKLLRQDKHKNFSSGLFSFNAQSDTALTIIIQISDGE